MIGIFIQAFRILKAMFIGLHDREFQSLTFLTVTLLASGTIFYVHVEGWRWIDAAYFSIATLTTVGYGDFVPQTDLGKIFTMLFIVGGIGLFLGFINRIGELSQKKT